MFPCRPSAGTEVAGSGRQYYKPIKITKQYIVFSQAKRWNGSYWLVHKPKHIQMLWCCISVQNNKTTHFFAWPARKKMYCFVVLYWCIILCLVHTPKHIQSHSHVHKHKHSYFFAGQVLERGFLKLLHSTADSKFPLGGPYVVDSILLLTRLF